MDAELFIHGPRHAFYGKQEESQYCQLFDNSQIKDEKRFVVEVRKGGLGKWYTYYTYCRYSNILDIDGRSGAYIGLTVRIDAYYANLRSLYTVLESIYQSKVVGLLLKRIPSGYQYLVSDFKNSQQAILDNVEKSLGAMLMGIFTKDDIIPIDSSFAVGGKEIFKGLDDNQYSEERLSDIKKTGKLIFASSKDIDIIAKMNDSFDVQKRKIKEEQDQKIAQISSSLEDANKVAAALKDDISDRDNQIMSLNEQKKNLEKELRKKDGENADLVSKLDSFSSFEDQLNALQKAFDSFKREKNSLECHLRNSELENDKLKDKLRRIDEENRKLKNQNFRSSSEPTFHDGHSHAHNADSHQNHSRDGRHMHHSQYPDKVSLKWRFSELGEGLKIGAFAFFLIVIGVAIWLLWPNNFGRKKTYSTAESIEKIEETNNVQRQQYTPIPNALTDRAYPDCLGGTTEDKLQITNGLEENHFILSLKDPSVSISSYQWIIKGSGSNVCVNKITDQGTIDFNPSIKDDYSIQVFVNDTLLVMKRISY